MVGLLVNNEVERMWKEAVMSKFEVIWHISKGMENSGV
jgi:hypothetical protein